MQGMGTYTRRPTDLLCELQMSDVKRIDVEIHWRGNDNAVLHEYINPTGKYVLATDYDALARENERLREMLATAGRQLDKAAFTISHTDSFRAKECWGYARECTALATDHGSP